MRRLSPALFLVLVAFTIPVAIELRTVAGFFGVDLPFVAVVVVEVVLLAVLVAIYVMGRLTPDEDEDGAATP
ncbi:CbaC protein [Halobellus litoreus]|jgi:predicted membrane channel-forming protein YqfA (hemolysin III family)|uniref:CbaC protein n=1 Tax=Halobellus litoreus TaxID=755310 RepID=A0ABD6DZE9_9EURY|nr:CbaC protein [Halobellus litoreus]